MMVHACGCCLMGGLCWGWPSEAGLLGLALWDWFLVGLLL